MASKEEIITAQFDAEIKREHDLAERMRGLGADDRRDMLLREFGQDGGAPMHRFFKIEAAEFDDEKQAFTFTFSSEYPGERYFGVEILDHSEGAVNLDRMNSGGAFCLNHDTVYGHVGSHEWARLFSKEGVCRGRAFLSKNNPRAVREYLDIKDGIRRHVSTSYWVHDIKLIRQRDDGVDEWLVTKWEVLENSTVAVPFDPTVGVGRAIPMKSERPAEESREKEKVMDDTKTIEAPEAPKAPAAPRVDIGAERADAEAKVMERVNKILKAGEKMGAADLAAKCIAEGRTYAEFVEAVLESRGAHAPAEPPRAGLTEKETRRFSLLNLVRAASDPDNKASRKAAGFELEACAASREAAEKAGYTVRGEYSIPTEVMEEKREYRGPTKRDVTVGPGGTGQYLVDTTMLSMVDLLDNAMMVRRLGAQVFGNLTGDVAFPKVTGGVTTYWVGEQEDVTESDPSFGSVILRPHTIGTYTDLTRRTLIQTSIQIENWLRARQMTDLALGVDLAAINGSGASNEPLGVLGTTGIGSVAGGTDGAAPTYAHMCALEREVSVDNALLGRVAFLTNPKVRYKLRQTPENATVPNSRWVYEGDGPESGKILGYPAFITNQVPSTLVKGSSGAVCSAVILGNWSDLYLGYWGPVSVNIDTATLSKSGGIRVVSLQDVDVALPRPQSFAAMQDATTT